MVVVAGATTVIDAFEVLPTPPSVELTVTELFFTPAVLPVTLSEKLQLALGANEAAESPTLEVPATAVIVPPPQEPDNPFGVVTTRPAGRLSVKPIPVSVVAVLGLVMVKVSEVLALGATVAAPNALTIVGGLATSSVAVAALPVPPLVEVTAPVVFV